MMAEAAGVIMKGSKSYLKTHSLSLVFGKPQLEAGEYRKKRLYLAKKNQTKICSLFVFEGFLLKQNCLGSETTHFQKTKLLFFGGF